MKDLVLDFPFLLDFIIISVSQMAKSNLSVSETAEIMENIQAAPNLGESCVTTFILTCFLSMSEDGYLLSILTQINP